MKESLKRLTLWLARLLGREIRDERTGESMGRVLCLTTPRGISMVGLPHAVRPVFLPEATTKYTKHRLGFATHEAPDYRSLHGAVSDLTSDGVLWAILVHQGAREVEALLRYWESLGYSSGRILFVHAGKRADFEELELPNKVFVEDPDIRTTFHPIEKQSYGGAFREIAAWLAIQSGQQYEAVALVEYDHIPVVSDWGERLCSFLNAEQADVLCHHLARVDGTNASHYLYQLSDTRFKSLWREISLREETMVTLNAVMTGSVWRRAAFEAVAKKRESFPVYLELYLPSLAHHLGFRVRGYGEQDRFVRVVPMEEPFSSKWRDEGAWSLHQVKAISTFF